MRDNPTCRARLGSAVLLAAAGAALAGCDGAGGVENCIRPTIAVSSFENRASFPLGWNLGDGVKDILVDRLVATERFTVVERPELAAILRELQFQHSGATRAQERAKRGRLKNVKYLIRGAVTDFGHVSTNRGGLSLHEWDIFGGSNRAVMGVTLYVVDVESGEIIASESISESIRAGDLTVKATYSQVAFGGSTFYRTPLGRATADVIDKAVDRISKTIASRPWVPKVALVQTSDRVILNGGRNRGVQAGDEYEVCDRGAPVVDPDTGDVIGHHSARRLGRVRVCRVEKGFSVANVLEGNFADLAPGQLCRRLPPAEPSEAPADAGL